MSSPNSPARSASRCTTPGWTPSSRPSLDELRKQADELRRSWARIMAGADAERRRVERDLHDGIYPPLLADSGLGEALRAAARRSPLPVTAT